MGLIFIIAIVIMAIYYSRDKKINETTAECSRGAKTNGVYVTRGIQRVQVATFSDGNVFWINPIGVERKIGCYDKEGKVYNSNGKMIGYVDGTNIFISRAFWLDFFREQYSFELKVPQLVFYIGEVLGHSTGSIFEADMDGRNQYENAAAYYETVETDLIGVGSSYLLLVYEGVIDSIHEKQFKMDPKEVLK